MFPIIEVWDKSVREWYSALCPVLRVGVSGTLLPDFETYGIEVHWSGTVHGRIPPAREKPLRF